MNELLEKLIIKNPERKIKDVIIGSIYVFVNKSNNKIYVGKTVQDYIRRFADHKCNALKKQLPNYLYKSIRKYGWENFDRYIIFQYKDADKIKVNDILCQKEQEYINLFNTTDHNYGYNLTKGGDGIVGFHFSEEAKKQMSENKTGEKHWNYGNTNGANSCIILQFDLDFNLIKEWPSIAEINRQLGINNSDISMCCNNTTDTYKGFIWVKKEDYYEGYLQKYKSRAKCASNDKTVLQFDLEGNLLNKFISCAEAGRSLNKKTVSSAANGRDPVLYGYIWIYEADYSQELLHQKLEAAKLTTTYKRYLKIKNS